MFNCLFNCLAVAFGNAVAFALTGLVASALIGLFGGGVAGMAVMVLRFQPLESQVGEFSLVEGEGGENQMADPKSSNEIFWNFLRVRLN